MITKGKIIALYLTIFLIAIAQNSKASIIPQSTWSLVYADSEETVGEDGAATNAFDGDASTFWHTQWYHGSPLPPHEIQINLGGIYDINGFRYLPRQDGGINGTISQYEFYVSSDGVSWGSPVATGTFAADTTEKEVLFSTTTAQFIRLRALSEVNGNPWTSAAEINVLGNAGSGNLAPDSIIDLPAVNITIQQGETVNFSGHGTDPDNNLPLSFAWHFGDGSGIADSSLQNPGTVQFNTPGVYTVTFTVTDSLGLSDPTPASRTVTVLNNSSGGIIPQSTWSLVYADSEETVGEDGAATNAFDGDASTFWHTQWYHGSPLPPHEIQINLGGIYDINGFRYLPRQDGGINGTISQYEFYVSSDGVSWGSPVATGTFAADTTEKEVLFSTTTAQFIRLRALSEVNGNPWTSAAEINVLGNAGSGNLAPDSIIDLPAVNITIQQGETVNFSGHGTDPDNNLPLSFAWHFGDGSGIADSSLQNPGTVQFNTPGVYTVTFTVTDSLGLSDPTPASRTVTVLNNSSGGIIPQSTWSLVYADSEETVGEDGAATNAFDGDASTFWHTQWYHGSPLPPHEIQINLGGIYDINGFRYLPRQDGGINGTISQYEFYVSSDGVSWGSPVATGTFAADTTEKEVLFSTTTAQFIRLRALSEVNGNPWTSAAEINVLGQCSKPSVVITSPEEYHIQTSTDLTVSANACFDSIIHSGWGVRFYLDGQSVQDDTSPPFQRTFQGVSKAEHTVEAIIIDDSGTEYPGFPTQDEVSHVGVGNYYVAFGDSITEGEGDTITSDDTSLDGRNSGGGYEPILNDLLTASKGYPQTVVNEGIGGEESIDGLARVQSVINAHPDAQYFLILFGTNDSGGSMPVPSGLGLSSGETGYSGSYKDNMQQIIDAIKNAGKSPILAKVPIALGSCHDCTPFADPDTEDRNTMYIQKYNQVVDELRSANGITAAAPDFYAYFDSTDSTGHLRYETQYFDNLHPNGIGYQSVADLWKNVLITLP